MASSHSPHHDTRKSHKSKARDRPSHSLRTGATDGPRKGGQGKGNWGRVGDEVKGAPISRHDPNYDPDDEVEDAENDEVSFQPPAPEKKRFIEGAADLTKYKRTVKDAAEEFLVSGDVAVFVSIIKKETRAIFGQELPVILIRLALDKPAPLRARLFALPKHLFDQGIINKAQVLQSFRKLFNLLDELSVDAPNAEKLIVEALQQSVTETIVDKKDSDSLIAARRLLANVEAVRAAKIRVKTIVDSYFNSGDTSDARLSLSELKVPYLHFEVVKQIVQTSLDRKDQQREMASVFIAELTDLLTTEEIAKAFTILLTRVEDLFLDVPDILHLLSSFVARAIRDESLPPAFLARVDLPSGDSSNQVVSRAQKLLSARGASVRLGRVWGAIQDVASDNESRSTGTAANGDNDEVSKTAHRNAMRRLRARKRAAAAKGIDPATITLASPRGGSSPSQTSANGTKKEQKLQVAQIIPTKPSPKVETKSISNGSAAAAAKKPAASPTPTPKPAAAAPAPAPVAAAPAKQAAAPVASNTGNAKKPAKKGKKGK